MTDALIAARDAFAAAHPERRIALNGREWGVCEAGAGPALLLIPGTLGRCDIFFRQIDALAPAVRVVSVSYPETGGVADWAGDLVALLDRLGIARATVLGSSLGGFLAQYLAGLAPERVERLVAANTLHSVAGLAERPPYSLDLESTPIGPLREGFAGGLMAWRAAQPEQAGVVDLLMAEVGGRIPEAELRTRLAALKHGPDLPPPGLDAARIVTVESDDDPLIPPAMRAAVRARLNPAVAYRFRTGGHFPYLARPDAYTSMLRRIMGLPADGPDWGDGPERAL